MASAAWTGSGGDAAAARVRAAASIVGRARVGELEPGLVAIAAPVFAADGRALGAISISGPALRLPPERLDEMGALLVEETTMLSERLGHRRPKEGAA